MIKAVLRTVRESAGEGLMENVLALIVVQFFRKILPLITIPYLARILGPSGWGLLAIFQSLVMCTVLLIEFGFHLYATRQVARCRNVPNQLSHVCAGVIGAQGVLSAGAAVLVMLLSFLVPVLREHRMLTGISLIWAISEGLDPIWYFLGVERMKIASLLEIVAKTAAAVAIVALVRSINDTGLVLALQAAAALATTAAAHLIMRRDVKFSMPSIKLIGEALRGGWPMFILRSAESLYTASNAFLLGLFAGPTVVSYFAGPEKITRALFGVLNPVRDSLYPRLSKLVHTSLPQAARLARLGVIVTGLGGLAVSAIAYFEAPLLIRLVLGARFEPAVSVLRMLAVLPPLVSVTQSIGMQWLLPLGRERVVAQSVVMAGILNIVLALILVPMHGQVGMAWAVISAEAFVCARVLHAALTDRDPAAALHRVRDEVPAAAESQDPAFLEEDMERSVVNSAR